MSFKTYHVRQRNVGQTVAQMLRGIYAGRSWGEVRRLIETRRVQLNGNLCLDEARKLRSGEIMRIADESLAKPPEQADINIRFQDEHLIVVEKPPGLTTLRHTEERDWDDKRKSRQPTLEELLQSMADRQGLSRLPGRGANASAGNRKGHRPPPARGGVKKHTLRVRPVHRLDRDTSGLMIFALSPAAETQLIRDFKAHTIERAYLAVVHGLTENRTIETQMVRDRGDGLRGSLPVGQTRSDSKKAVTHIRTVRHFKDSFSLIEARLETGRTHQIRIHLSEIGHMLAGEKIYTRPAPDAPAVADHSDAPRQALHAYRLRFQHPITKARHTFESKWPRDLHRWLTKLEKSTNGD